MICLTPKPSRGNFLNNWSFFIVSIKPDHKSLLIRLYWGVFKNKTNATSHSNIGSLKTAIEEDWNRTSQDFILKEWKSFWRRVDTIIEKKMVAILSKFTVLCLSSYFVVYFLKLKLILF